MRDYNSIPFKLPRRTAKADPLVQVVPHEGTTSITASSKALSTVNQNSVSMSTQESTPEKETAAAGVQQQHKQHLHHPLQQQQHYPKASVPSPHYQPLSPPQQQQQRRSNANINNSSPIRISSNNSNYSIHSPNPLENSSISKLRNALEDVCSVTSSPVDEQTPGISATTNTSSSNTINKLTASSAMMSSPNTTSNSSNNTKSIGGGGADSSVILELRSSLRQLRRQLDKLQDEKTRLEQEHLSTVQELQFIKKKAEQNSTTSNPASPATTTTATSPPTSPFRSNNNTHHRELQQQQQIMNIDVGELQVQLDRAHAQILTADMVRKELEDTLEAEQYTWELRVQDQERAIQSLREECAVLQEDLQACRQQWKEAEEAYAREVEELQDKLEKTQQEAGHWKNMERTDSQDIEQLKIRLLELEQERGELQGCLDEALKELEAVDAELQSDSLRKENERLQDELLQLRNSGGVAAGVRGVGEDDPIVLESLKHLHRWVLERIGEESSAHSSSPQDAQGLLSSIQSHLERMDGATDDNNKEMEFKLRNQVADLNSQISVYRGDLKAREESSAELRASLKEAVALLRPLQDAVAKSDKDKAKLIKELEELRGKKGDDNNNNAQLKSLKGELDIKDQEVDRLKTEIVQLELELSRAKVTAASSLITAHRASVSESGAPDSLIRTREELKAKRATEKNLKQLLKDAQTRFQTLHTQNLEIEAMNSELQGRLHDAAEKLDTKPSTDSDPVDSIQKQLISRDAQIQNLQMQLESLETELAKKDAALRNKAQEVENCKSAAVSQNDVSQNDDKARLRDSQARLNELEANLTVSKDELHAKRETEKALKKSLKEALSLLKPLQTHLEEAESEKKELLEEILKLRKKNEEEGKLTKAHAFSKDSSAVRELEETVRLLEMENAQLHDALEDMSQSINASHVSGNTGSSNKHDSRLREEIVQLKSRSEVTQKQLEMAKKEKSTLAETMRQRQNDEREVLEEMKSLREKLRKTEAELENAKFIATSALVKVEELSMGNVEQQLSPLNNGNFDQESMFHEKARYLDREMKATREQSRVQYRLT